MVFQCGLASSQEKFFFDWPDDFQAYTGGSMFKNEIHSFQLIAWFSSNEAQTMVCDLEISSPLAHFITVYQVDYVPALVPSIPIDDDDDYITKLPGLFPDPLHQITNGKITLLNGQTRAFWFCLEPDGQIFGKFPVTVRIFDQNHDAISEQTCYIEIINAALPPCPIRNTGWFHGDCLATLHNVEIMSEEYFSIVEKYLAVYVKFGHNMILTPVFTPPLDTDVGMERPTNQLVDVTVCSGKYGFEFTKLKRWIQLCQSCGVEWFEISHLFTQWGAKHAPKIMAWVDDEYTRIFGWETDSQSKKYQEFLHAFLPELVAELEQIGILDRCYFHISDEPFAKDEAAYRAGREILQQYVDEARLIDAMHEYVFYEKRLIQTPIVSNDHIHTFIEKGATNLWTYYCMGQRKSVANRFMAMPAYRNRILGYQLYKYRIQGFLHWGFNFWFSERSRSVLDPYRDSCAGGGFPSGDPFVVYPLDKNGEVVCSTRLYVFYEGLQDLRALTLLENLTNREAVEALLTEIDGFGSYPRNNLYIPNLRETINRLIQENLT